MAELGSVYKNEQLQKHRYEEPLEITPKQFCFILNLSLVSGGGSRFIFFFVT